MKLEQHWPRLQRRSHFKLSTFFPYKFKGLKQMHTEANLTSPYKGQMSMYDHHLSNFGNLPSLIIYVKIQPQGILSSGEEDF